MKKTLAERLWSQVRIDRGCWVFTGGTHRGYGHINWNQKNWRVHRVAWILTHGPIPDGLCVLHRCDNRPCVRPSHLFLGTQIDNIKDMRAKGRGRWIGYGATHCVHGHEYTEANVYSRGPGKRECRICIAASHAKYERRIALERAAS